jgi:hypothetical protein
VTGFEGDCTGLSINFENFFDEKLA